MTEDGLVLRVTTYGFTQRVYCFCQYVGGDAGSHKGLAELSKESALLNRGLAS